MRASIRHLTLLAFSVGLYACGGGDSVAPSPTLSQAEVNQLVSDVDAISMRTLGDALTSAFPGAFSISASDAKPSTDVATLNRTFSATRSCPAGGTVTVSGSIVGTGDPITRNLNVTSTVTRTEAACAFTSGGSAVSITGTPNVTMTGAIDVVGGIPVGAQSQTHAGSFTWSRGSASGSCTVNVTSGFNPAAMMLTVTGTVCGRAVNVSRMASGLF